MGPGLLVVCSPQPICVSPTNQSTVPSCLVREPPLSYRAPGSQVTDLGRGRWRQWLPCFPPQHHSARADCATQMSSGLWLLSLIFSSPTVWSFLFLLRLLILGKLDTPLFGSSFPFPKEPRAAATVLPATCGAGATSAQPTSHTCFLPAHTTRLNTPAQATI